MTSQIDAYPITLHETIRYRDIDKQGHVNNAVYVTYVESARTALMYDPARALLNAGCEIVIAKLELDYLREIHWPGEVTIGTRVSKIGNSSLVLEHGVFQGEICAATASTVIVMIDSQTRKAAVFSDAAKEKFEFLKSPDLAETGSSASQTKSG